jgi:polyhydroxyalkanoate synthesis repressor PhaR
MATKQEPPSPAADAEPVRITRYPNRRLYDWHQKRYVRLEEVADIVRRGGAIIVRDSKTGEDITRAMLAQIILEYHPDRMELLPVRVLNAMIRTNEEVLEFLRDYFRQALAYLDVFQRQGTLNPMLLPMQWMRSLLPFGGQPAGTAPRADAPDTAALLDRIAELERRINELQPEREKTEPAKAGRGRKSARARGS